MKILFLQDDFPPQSFGGAGISAYELAVGMQKAGHEVFVITACRKESEAGESYCQGLTVFKIASDYHERWRPWVSLYNPSVIRQVEFILKKIQPDVVHANNIHCYLSYHCLKIAKRYAKRVVWTARDAMAVSYGKLATDKYFQKLDPRLSWRDNLRQAGKRYNPLRNFLIRRYLNYADARFAVSEALKEVLEKNGIRSVAAIHTGIDAAAWQASAEAVTAFKSHRGLIGKKVVLFGGRLGARREAVKAMRLVAERMPHAVLVVMGKDENAEAIKRDIPIFERSSKNRDSNPRLDVVFTGWLSGEEKIVAYCASDIVWVPSPYFDAFPRSALEASAAGKPLIATKFGGAPELVVDGETGYVVNPFQSREIADKTLALLQDPEKAAAIGRAGRERVLKDFNFDTYIARYLAAYRSV
ncbi:glycosyltransferase family 4 protein [Candidatus Kaiserbacteria bacterium]|nr:glycosyltransferase family 4 protein [Candidatus Kaiserbacteria bacterium]